MLKRKNLIVHGGGPKLSGNTNICINTKIVEANFSRRYSG
jgi:hypothetical protein